MSQLHISNLIKHYQGSQGPVTVLNGVSLAAEGGDTVAIVGPSGAGKSTLLNIIGSLDAADGGAVRLDDVEVSALTGAALADYRATRVGFVFQDHHLLPQLTALENVLLPTLAVGASNDAPARARELLERLGIAERAEAFPAQMSGGERQRAAIARALINRPAMLLCDEPTGNVDRTAGSAIITLLLELAAQQGVIVLMVTHNLEHAARFARCFELHDGILTPQGGTP